MSDQELEVQSGDKKIRVRGSDVLGIVNLVAIVLLVYGGYQHTVEAKEESRIQTSAITENTRALREQAGEMRVANCFAALTPEQKKFPETIAFCKSLASVR